MTIRYPWKHNPDFATIERTWKDADAGAARTNQCVVALMRGPQVLFALAQQPTLRRSELLNVQRAHDGYWQAGGVRFAPFTAVHEAPYSAYVRLA